MPRKRVTRNSTGGSSRKKENPPPSPSPSPADVDGGGGNCGNSGSTAAATSTPVGTTIATRATSRSKNNSEDEDLANIVVISEVVAAPPISAERGESGGESGSTSPEEDEGRGGGGGGRGGIGEVQSYCIVVNTDGSLALHDADKETDLVPGQEKFSVTLPKNKVKSLDNPLPGAVPIPAQPSRRKSKPEGETYGGEGGDMSMLTQSVQQTAATHGGIDLDEFTNQLDPQSLATLETLIQSQQLIENLGLVEGENVVGVGLDGGEEGGSALHGEGAGSTDSSSIDSSPVGVKGRRGGGTKGRSTISSTSRLSESDSKSSRRSQRQQDRIERQEAERILAENQQMLQREKEAMQGNKAPVVTTLAAPAKRDPHISAPALKLATPGRAIVSSTTKRDSVDSQGSDKKPYPKRENRRLPAHLADPNYISLGEEVGKGRSSVDNSGSAPSASNSVDSVDADADDEEGDEDYVVPDAGSIEDDDIEYTEDDPNKLWCICRTPHNNRFMICCDTCEDWFHGKCVGVTKAQGKAMELRNILWVCPRCKKRDAEKRKGNKGAVRVSQSSRMSTNDAKPGTGNRLSKSAAAQKADAAAAAMASKAAVTLGKSSSSSSPSKTFSSLRKSEKSEGGQTQSCVVCNKAARKDSVYCSDQCVQQYADNLGNKTNDKDGTSTTSTSPSKLKRSNSNPDAKPSEPIFNFHVISAGASKSTEVVSAKTKEKETTASQILKAQKEAQSPTKGHSPPGSQDASKTGSPSSSSSALIKKSSTDGKSSSKYDEKSLKTRHSSQSESQIKSKSSRKSESYSSKDKEKSHSGNSEKLHRENIRKGLREILTARMKELSGEEQNKINSSSYTPGAVADKISEELCKIYGGATTVKCKTKYRSIYFNLKDGKNMMFQELLFGSLHPKNLVKMEPTEMASQELANWRKQEAEKQLEAIKKSELDKIAESKKQKLLEDGVYDAAAVAQELLRPLDINDVIDQSGENHVDLDVAEKVAEKEKKSNSGKSSSHSHSSKRSHRDREKETKSHHDKDKREKDSGRRRSPRRKSEKESSSSTRRDKEKERSSSTSSSQKDKVKHSDSNTKQTQIVHKDERKVSSGSSASASASDDQSKSPEILDKATPPEVATATATISQVTPPPPPDAVPIISTTTPAAGIRSSLDSEQEQPSSTIKTPDFADEQAIKKECEPHLFQTKIVMPELGSFQAYVHSVSHASVEGFHFPDSPVPVVGRISPETVWDYINKMKKTKEVIVFRLSPASPDDSEGYMTFFSYFSSRSRLGVMGGIVAPLKDVYLIPLPKQAPIPRSLLPFRGPGLPQERTHCLLCVVTRNIRDPSASLAIKRKSSLTTLEQVAFLKKKVKMEPSKAQPSSSQALPLPQKAMAKDEDDDAPYTPWEEEESSSSNSDSQPGAPPTPAPPSKLVSEGAAASSSKSIDVQLQLQELEAKIAKEKQDIEKITGALAMSSTMSGIPGLDGEFGEGETQPPTITITPAAAALTPTTSIQEAAPPPPPSAASMDDPRLRKGQRFTAKTASPPSFSLVPATTTATLTSALSIISSDTELQLQSSIPNTDPAKEDQHEVMEICSEDSSSKEEPEVLRLTKSGEEQGADSEEAYSPSAAKFSDEESSGSTKQVEGESAAAAAASQVCPMAEEEVEPTVVPIAEVKETETSQLVLPVQDMDVETGGSAAEAPLAAPLDIKISMPKLGSPTKALQSATATTTSTPPPSTAPQQALIDLDDFQPMLPPLKQKQEEEGASDSVFDQAPATSLPKPAPTNASAAVKKININLTTKQLPTPVEEIKEQPFVPEPGSFASILSQLPRQLPPPPPTPQSQSQNQNQTNSVVINFNVPPPILPMMSRPPPPPGGGGGGGIIPPPPMGYIPRPPYFLRMPLPPPPPQIQHQPQQHRPGFTPSFGGSAVRHPPPPIPMPSSSSGMDIERERERRGLDVNDDPERVARVNLDRERERGDDVRGERSMSRGGRGGGRPFRGGFRGGRGHFGRRFDRSRSPIERIRRRRRSRSRSPIRDRSSSSSRSRSRSRSPRERGGYRKRRRSRSKSKSPFSKKWEARNRSRSPASPTASGERR